MTRDWMLTLLAVAAPYLLAALIAAATLSVTHGLGWAKAIASDRRIGRGTAAAPLGPSGTD